jgi:hypothetical protein
MLINRLFLRGQLGLFDFDTVSSHWYAKGRHNSSIYEVVTQRLKLYWRWQLTTRACILFLCCQPGELTIPCVMQDIQGLLMVDQQNVPIISMGPPRLVRQVHNIRVEPGSCLVFEGFLECFNGTSQNLAHFHMVPGCNYIKAWTVKFKNDHPMVAGVILLFSVGGAHH